MKIERAKRATIAFLALVILVGSITTIAGYRKEITILPNAIKVFKTIIGGGDVEVQDGITIESETGEFIYEDGTLSFDMLEEIDIDTVSGSNQKTVGDHTFTITNNNDFDVEVNISNDNFYIEDTDLSIRMVMWNLDMGSVSKYNSGGFAGTKESKSFVIPAKSTSGNIQYTVFVQDLYPSVRNRIENDPTFNASTSVSVSFEVIQA